MEHMRIRNIVEEDIDEVIRSAGGFRICKEGSADYQLNEAVLELKLVSEEGFEKIERQEKLASLFRESQPRSSIVVIDPKRLNRDEIRRYYRIVEAPIKTACKKASKQLQITAARFDPPPVRVLVILNVGYTLLSSSEFKDVCIKCVHNDTSGIDWVVCGGIYFYSDTHDNLVIGKFEDAPVNLSRSFPSGAPLLEAWDQFLSKAAMEAVKSPIPISHGRSPVLDLAFELDGVRYVKPAPVMPSTFWPGGVAPRDNTSGINTCPPVARTFPTFSEYSWRQFRAAMPSAARLKLTYKDWVKSYPDEALGPTNPLKPLVFVEIVFEDFSNWIDIPKSRWRFSDIGAFSNVVLRQRAVSLLQEARNKEEIKIIPPDYIHLVVNEVGTDKANDFASIYYVSEIRGFDRKEMLVENAKLFFEYGMAVSASYAIKRKVNAILYTTNRVH